MIYNGIYCACANNIKLYYSFVFYVRAKLKLIVTFPTPYENGRVRQLFPSIFESLLYGAECFTGCLVNLQSILKSNRSCLIVLQNKIYYFNLILFFILLGQKQ